MRTVIAGGKTFSSPSLDACTTLEQIKNKVRQEFGSSVPAEFDLVVDGIALCVGSTLPGPEQDVLFDVRAKAHTKG